jgi:hypothetical protein
MIAGLLLASGCENPAGDDEKTIPAASEYSITLTQPENGSFTVKPGDGTPTDGNSTAAPGATVTLTATPAQGWEFEKFTVTGAAVDEYTTNPAVFTMPLENITVTAVFKAEEGGDTTPPVVSVITPADNATGVGITGSIGITFSEDIKTGSGAGAELADGAISGANLAAWLPGFKFGTSSGGNEAAGAISAASYSRAANTLTLNFTGLANSTLYYLTIDGICDTAGNALVQTVKSFTTAPAGTKTVSAGPQSGTPAYGTAGNAVYAVTTANIEDSATATVNWMAGTPAGVTDNTGTVTVTGNALSLTLTTTAGTPAGTWNFTVTIDGATSAQQSLTVNKAAVTALGITLAAPVKGTALATAATVGSTPAPALSASSVNVSWNPPHTTAAAETTYTATLILAAGANYSLAGIAAEGITASGATPGVQSKSDENATVTLVFPETEEDAVSTYAITVTQPENGGFTVQVGGDSPGNASTTSEAGTTITLTATADPNYQFKQWSVTGVTLDDGTANPATFTMPAGAVTVTAEFEATVTNHTVTFNAMGGANGPEAVIVAAGQQVDAPEVTGMTSSDPIAASTPFGGWFTDTTLRTPVEFPITVNEDIEVYAKWDNKFVLVAANQGWQVVGQVVWLAPGTYKLGVEYKLGRNVSAGTYSKLTVSVQYVSNGATQAPPPFKHFENGNHETWTREETDFTATLNTDGGDKGYGGWYRVGIEDGARSASDRRSYVNRIWLYPENATSAEENKLTEADFPVVFTGPDWRDGERFLDVSNGGPFYSNTRPTPYQPDPGTQWGPACTYYWGKTGDNLWREADPSIENY